MFSVFLFSYFTNIVFPICLGILPIVLSSNVFTPYSLIRLTRNTQTQDLKVLPSTLGGLNHVQVNNKSQIVLLSENSTELNDNFILKEQYELQNETGYFLCI